MSKDSNIFMNIVVQGWNRVFVQPWSMLTGGVLVGILSVITFAWSRPWGVVGGLRNWADWFFYSLGIYGERPYSALVSTNSILTLGLMLSLLRGIPKANAGVKAGEWLKKELVGTELYGKTLGVIGFGNIGEAVARRALAFDMHVLAADPVRKPDEIKAAGAEPVDLDDLLARSDIITLHIPHIKATHYLLDAEAFTKMKDGVRIVCAARGGVIDQSALLSALESGKVAGAALDVFETEPPGEEPLVLHPKVIGTPHIGAQTREAQLRAGHDILSEVVAALDGEPLRWKIV